MAGRFSPFQIAITPDGTRAYVANQSSTNTVSVIDTANNIVVATIPGGFSPLGVAITPDGTQAYVTNDFSNTVSVIDTATNTVVATIPVGGSPAILTSATFTTTWCALWNWWKLSATCSPGHSMSISPRWPIARTR